MVRATDTCVVEALCEQWTAASLTRSLEAAAEALDVEFQRPVLVRERGEWFLASGFVNGVRATGQPLEVGDVLEPHAPLELHGRCWRVVDPSRTVAPIEPPSVEAPDDAWRVFEDARLEAGDDVPARARGPARLRLLGLGAPMVATGAARVTFDANGFVTTLAVEATHWPSACALLKTEPLFRFVRAIEVLGPGRPGGDEPLHWLREQGARARASFPLVARLFWEGQLAETDMTPVRLRPRETPVAPWSEPAVLDVTRHGKTQRQWLGAVNTVWRDVERGVTFVRPGVPEAMPLLSRQRGRWVLLPGREPFWSPEVTGALRHGDSWTLADGTALRFLQFPE
jgi:hypothetical protein